VGILLDREQEADSIFSVINKNYLAACSLVASDASRQKPSVLYGKMHGDNWYAMGGASFISRICRDASAHYFLSEDDRSGGVNLDFEDVYAKANDVDFWIVQSKGRDAITYETLGAEDERYVDFRPWKEHRVITCDMGNTPFNELSPMEPDTVLLDFIHAFHSDILKDYQPKYYKVL
jgi:iron complex transport system substrate-binding protein